MQDAGNLSLLGVGLLAVVVLVLLTALGFGVAHWVTTATSTSPTSNP